MQDWQKISLLDHESLICIEDSQSVVLDVDLKKIRKYKNIESKFVEFKSIAHEKKLNVSLWITNPKSIEDLTTFLTRNPVFELADVKFFILSLQSLDIQLNKDTAKKTFLDFSNISPKDYEKQFNTAAKLHYRGIILDAQIFKRSHIVLAHKFNLDFAISGIMYERHLQAANASETDLKIFG